LDLRVIRFRENGILKYDDSELMIFDLLHIKVGTDNFQQTSFEVFLLITAGLILSINFELAR
jgi:hypothetical protein